MSWVSSITRVVSRTGHEDTQVVVDVSSTPDPDYVGIPKQVMYGYKSHTDHLFTYRYKSPDHVDHLSLDVSRSTGSYRLPRGNVYR